MKKEEKLNWYYGIFFPLGLTVLLWGIHLYFEHYGISQGQFGVIPRSKEGLLGIITSPLMHGSFKHLINNSAPLLVLGWGLFYFYRKIAFSVTFWIWILSGIWLWISGREGNHIGASGLIYGLFTFLFVSGLIRKYKKLIGLSFLVAFLYGSLFWGLFPFKPQMSWEGHVWGAVAGIAMAIYYRKEGPQRPKYQWEIEEELEEEVGDHSMEYDGEKTPDSSHTAIKYHYKKKE